MYPMLRCNQVLVRSSFPEARQDLEQAHPAFVANRTDIEGLSGKDLVTGSPIEELRIDFGWRSVKEFATKGKSSTALAIGKESEVAYFGEALGKNVDKESADELVCIENHNSDAVVFFSILPLECDSTVLKRYQTVVGNGDAVSVTADIIEDLSGSTEGRFGIDDPFMLSVCA